MRKYREFINKVIFFAAGIVLALSLMFYFYYRIASRVELCKIYYSEMSLPMCFLSDVALPSTHRSK